MKLRNKRLLIITIYIFLFLKINRIYTQNLNDLNEYYKKYNLRSLENNNNIELSSEMVFDLFNLQDNLFGIKVKVGSPSQTLNLIVDISSELTFLKVPKCLDTSCDENFEKNENMYKYDPNNSNSKKLIQKDSKFFYNNIKYEADLMTDIFSFPIAVTEDNTKKYYYNTSNQNINQRDNHMIFDNFSFFIIDENINIDFDGVLGLNAFIIVSNYVNFSFVEYAKAKNYISEKTFAINYVDKYHAKLYLGKNNFEKRTQNILNLIDTNNNNLKSDLYNKLSNNLNNINDQQDEEIQSKSYSNKSLILKMNFFISSCKTNQITSSQSLSHYESNYKNNLNFNKKINTLIYSWNCKTSHLIIGEENNFYKAFSFENSLFKRKNELDISLTNTIPIIEFSTKIKNIIIDIDYINLIYEKYAKEITPFCIIKNENKISYINCEKSYLDSTNIPSLNFILNGFSYKILGKDLFEQIYGDSDNLYYRLRISFTKTPENKWIFGHIFLKNNLIEFNKQKSSIIFYEGFKYDLSKFISDSKENFCLYNIFNYLFVLAMVFLCMFYVYRKEKKKNQIIEVPYFLKKNNSMENVTEKNSLTSYKYTASESDGVRDSNNLNIKHFSSNSLFDEKINLNYEKPISRNNLPLIQEDKNEKLIDEKFDEYCIKSMDNSDNQIIRYDCTPVSYKELKLIEK